MTQQPQQTPYIGSKISLISKLDIRYEGILYTVDSQEATIALSKVKSFGTEDRPTPHPVPGRDEVYEYIIFKASDIKDLIVCDTPKPVPNMGGLPYDPAILSVSQQPLDAKAHPSAEHVHSTLSSHSVTPRESPPLPMGAQVPNRAPGAGRSQFTSQNEGYQPQQRNRAGFQNQQYRNQQRQDGGAGGGYQRGGGYHQQAGGFYNNQQQPHYHYQNRGRGVGFQNNKANLPIRTNQPREKLKFDSDYDFEKANEQFKETIGDITKDLDAKLNIGGEHENSSSPKNDHSDENTADDNEKFYDKNSSFFDSISCEALEKQEGKNTRPDWRKERMTNQETFGPSAVRSLGYRRGGRGYGGPRGMRGNQRYNNGYVSSYGRTQYTSNNNRSNNRNNAASNNRAADF